MQAPGVGGNLRTLHRHLNAGNFRAAYNFMNKLTTKENFVREVRKVPNLYRYLVNLHPRLRRANNSFVIVPADGQFGSLINRYEQRAGTNAALKQSHSLITAAMRRRQESPRVRTVSAAAARASNKNKASALNAETRHKLGKITTAMNARKAARLLQQIAHNTEVNALREEQNRAVKQMSRRIERLAGGVRAAFEGTKTLSVQLRRAPAQLPGSFKISHFRNLNALKHGITMLSVNNTKFQNELKVIKKLHENKYKSKLIEAPLPPNRKNYIGKSSQYNKAKRNYNSNIKTWIIEVARLYFKNKHHTFT